MRSAGNPSGTVGSAVRCPRCTLGAAPLESILTEAASPWKNACLQLAPQRDPEIFCGEKAELTQRWHDARREDGWWKMPWASCAGLHAVTRSGNDAGGPLRVLDLAPGIIEHWLRRARNQAETSSGVLSFIWQQGHSQFQAQGCCLEEQLQVGRSWFAGWFGRKSGSWLRFIGCFFKANWKAEVGTGAAFRGRLILIFLTLKLASRTAPWLRMNIYSLLWPKSMEK